MSLVRFISDRVGSEISSALFIVAMCVLSCDTSVNICVMSR